MSREEKSRTSITLSEAALETAKKRYRELGYGSLSEMVEALILQDAAEKREHIVVRGPEGARYSTKTDDNETARREAENSYRELDGE